MCMIMMKRASGTSVCTVADDSPIRSKSRSFLLIYNRRSKSCWKVTVDAEPYFGSRLHSLH